MNARYLTAEEVPVQPWYLQGTIYDTPNEAKYAAAKLYALSDNFGVIVKHVKGGWTLLFWRKAGFRAR